MRQLPHAAGSTNVEKIDVTTAEKIDVTAETGVMTAEKIDVTTAEKIDGYPETGDDRNDWRNDVTIGATAAFIYK